LATHAGLREQTDRLDSSLVYHVLELSRELERLAKQAGAGGAAPARSIPLYSSPAMDAVLSYFGYDIVIPSTEIGLISFLVRHGSESVEPGVTTIIRKSLSAGKTSIDVGANVGLHCVTMAHHVGAEGRVVAVEANAAIASALQKTVRLNALASRVSVHVGAASDQTGTATFYQLPHSPESSLYPQPGGEPLDVKTFRVDDLVPDGAPVDLVKIDVEGAEALVYRGMSRVLAQNPGIRLIMEWSASHFARTGIDPGALYHRIREDGFNAFLIDDERPGELAPIQDPSDRLEGSNLFFTRGSARNR
jgi:FkbM family methyltransferase